MPPARQHGFLCGLNRSITCNPTVAYPLTAPLSSRSSNCSNRAQASQPQERRKESMRKKMLPGFIVASLALVLLSARPVQAQPSLYFQAVTNLHPVGYWPMHEIQAPAPGNI